MFRSISGSCRDDSDGDETGDSEFGNERPTPSVVRSVSFTSEMLLEASEVVAHAVAAHRAQQDVKERATKSLNAAIGERCLCSFGFRKSLKLIC